MKDAISAGVDGYDADVKNAVRKAAHGLRLTREAAMSIASKAVSAHYSYFSPMVIFILLNSAIGLTSYSLLEIIVHVFRSVRFS